jgi:hypothetical protein
MRVPRVTGDDLVRIEELAKLDQGLIRRSRRERDGGGTRPLVGALRFC